MIFLVFIACLIAVVGCPLSIMTSPDTSRLYRWVTALTGLVVIGLAYVLTYHYVYLPDSNTRVLGWPVPWAVLQRDAPGEPWLDFVGPTVVLALPLNIVLLLGAWLFALWIWHLIVMRIRKRSAQPTDGQVFSESALCASSETPSS